MHFSDVILFAKINSKSRPFISPNLYKTKFMLYRQKSECREFLSTVYFSIIPKSMFVTIKMSGVSLNYLFVYFMYSILSIQIVNHYSTFSNCGEFLLFKFQFNIHNKCN